MMSVTLEAISLLCPPALFDTDYKSNKHWRVVKGCELLQLMMYLTQDQPIFLLILSINGTLQCFSKPSFLRMPFL